MVATTSAFYAWRAHADNRLITQLDNHPVLKFSTFLNQSSQGVWIENSGKASALNVQLTACLMLFDTIQNNISGWSETSKDEWSIQEIPAYSLEPFIVELAENTLELARLFDTATLKPGQHILEIRITYKRAVDSLRYLERAFYVYESEQSWISAKGILTNAEKWKKFGAALQSARQRPAEEGFITKTDAIDSRTGYGAELKKK